MLEKRTENRQGLEDFLKTRESGYKRTARSKIGSSKDLVRIHDKFATVYAAGCLAIREEILPFEGKDLLEAILTCEQDHVRFISDELGGQPTGIEILSAYIEENHHTFINLQKDKLPPNHDHENCPGYINEHRGRAEYLFSENKLREIIGGKQAANELKKELHSRGLIATVSAGEGEMRYCTKRMIGGQRKPVVAISGNTCHIGHYATSIVVRSEREIVQDRNI